eukprot:6200022-Pyramimonas_sp.AAC.1
MTSAVGRWTCRSVDTGGPKALSRLPGPTRQRAPPSDGRGRERVEEEGCPRSRGALARTAVWCSPQAG